MADAFISYRRDPSYAIADAVHEKLKSRHGIDAYLDVERRDSNKVTFPERLMRAIEESPTFICFLADKTLESEWVRKEIQRAYELKKHCIPVFQESYKPVDGDEALDYLLSFDGVHIFDKRGLMVNESVAQIAELVIRHPIPQPKRNFAVLAGSIGAVFALIVIVLLILSSQNDSATPTSQATKTQVVAMLTDELSPTLSPEELAYRSVRNNQNWIPYERDFDGVTMALVPAGDFIMGATQQEIDGAFFECEQLRGVGACSRAWFDHQVMNGNNTQVFNQPFWIDKYEVSQEQFTQWNGRKGISNAFSGNNLPVENITWFEAKAFCESRGARLPTEAEWEYVARGPSNLIYPWGNSFISNNVVYWANSNNQTARIGSKPNGQSWVGAIDMVGNVWEWTSSADSVYPYNTGMENPDNTTIERIFRGASWNYGDQDLRASFRGSHNPTYTSSNVGFRCARDYDE
jgi:formylglycine-generating enzyme required for sulfatase activity